MNDKIRQLRETRGDALAEAQRVIDGARGEDRDLNDVERRSFDAQRELADRITDRLEELEGEEQRWANTDRAFRRAGVDEHDVRLGVAARTESAATPASVRR